MDNNIIHNDNKNTDRARPGAGAVFAVVFLEVLLSVLMFLSLRIGAVEMLIPQFIAVVACQTYLLYFVRSPFTLLIPCTASLLCLPALPVVFRLPGFLPAFVCLCAVLVFSALFALLLMRRAESFRFFITAALLYSVLFGAMYAFLMIEAFGSISAGLETLKQLFAQTINSLDLELGEEMRAILVEMADALVLMLPSIVCTFGIFAAWLTKWILSAASALSGVKKQLFARITYAPVGLAVTFAALTLFGMIFSFASESVYYASVNVRSVLTVIFMGEGIREYIDVFRTNGFDRRKYVFIIVGAVLLMFFPTLLVTVAAYFGAYRTVFRRVRVIKITKD